MAEELRVVLLHGLGRTRLAMWPLAMHLRRQGFDTINIGYFGPAGLEASVSRVRRSLTKLLDAGQDVHFVTHSMGGIVARGVIAAWRDEDESPRTGRLVQLAPPNQGSSLADRIRRVPLADHVPAFLDLGETSGGGPPLQAARPLGGYEVGVIAGQSFGPWHDQPSDGVVRVAETYLPEAVDWILLDHFHTLVMNGRDTWANVVTFLREGQFLPNAPRLGLDPDGRVGIRDKAGYTPLRRLSR